MKNKAYLFVPIALLLALVAAAAGALVRSWERRRLRAERTARGETALRVVNPGGARLALYRAGRTLDRAQPAALDAGETWLADDRYFLEARAERFRLFFPVSFEPSRPGPDAEGSFVVTIRAPGVEAPPALDERFSRFALVPAGHFEMGNRRNPGQSQYVWLSAYYLGIFEVTNAEFRRFLADPEGYDERDNWTEAGWSWKAAGKSQATARLEPSHPRYPRFGQDDLPVVLVTWYEANAYCRWLTRRLGQGRWLFRLPTEAEWEKAARGPDGFEYGLGLELSEPESPLYNWKKNPDAETTLVGYGPTTRDYRPNRYGLYHVSGNAAEWTQSVFRHFNREQPHREDDRNLDAAPGMRVTRGGSWYSANAVRLHLAYREEFQPELSSDDLGFRVAAVLGGGAGRPD